MYEQNKDYKDKTALKYFDRKITYGQLFKEIEKTANAFCKLGVSHGDIVAVIAVTIPETIYTFYGLNRIGAVSNMIDPRTSVEGIREYIQEVDARTVVVIDAAYGKISEAVNGIGVENVIVISPADSLPVFKSFAYKLTKQKTIVRKIYCKKWKDFIEEGESQTFTDTPYEKDECCVIVHTGGTTGIPKGVMLSNDNLNCSAFQLINSDFEMSRGDIWADVMPPFIAYGIGNGLHMPLVKGMEVVLIPVFDSKRYDKLMIKYKPNHIVGVPSHYENIISSKKIRKREIPYLISPVVGGDSMKTDLEKKVNEFIKSHNGKNNVMKGYGMTEVSAAVSACMSDRINKTGSVGIPFAHTVISVFDFETGKEMKYGEKGEVCMTGPNTMIGYFGREDETNSVIRIHSDGKPWVHSGDIGYMDEDGFLFVEGRAKRMIIRHDGFKVFPSLIEDVVLKKQWVRECCCVGVPDSRHTQGMLPVVYAVLAEPGKKNVLSVLEEIMELCKEELPEYAQPTKIKIVERLPLTGIGKIDYVSLEEKAAKESNKQGAK